MAHVTTQMDFDTKAVASWVHARRAEGFAPGVIVGVPGVADPQKLMSIAARIGVKDAKRFLVKNLRFVTGLAKSGGFYKPTGFVEGIAPLLADPAANVTGFHLYTFNAVEATEGWRREIVARAGGPRPRLIRRLAPEVLVPRCPVAPEPQILAVECVANRWICGRSGLVRRY